MNWEVLGFGIVIGFTLALIVCQWCFKFNEETAITLLGSTTQNTIVENAVDILRTNGEVDEKYLREILANRGYPLGGPKYTLLMETLVQLGDVEETVMEDSLGRYGTRYRLRRKIG